MKDRGIVSLNNKWLQTSSNLSADSALLLPVDLLGLPFQLIPIPLYQPQMLFVPGTPGATPGWDSGRRFSLSSFIISPASDSAL